MTWALTVNDRRYSWKTFSPVDGVHNRADFSTGRTLGNRAAVPVIHGVPRSMKKRME